MINSTCYQQRKFNLLFQEKKAESSINLAWKVIFPSQKSIYYYFLAGCQANCHQIQGKRKRTAAEREVGPAPNPSDSKGAAGAVVATRKTILRTEWKYIHLKGKQERNQTAHNTLSTRITPRTLKLETETFSFFCMKQDMLLQPTVTYPCLLRLRVTLKKLFFLKQTKSSVQSTWALRSGLAALHSP